MIFMEWGEVDSIRVTKPHKGQKHSILTIWLTYIEWSFFRSECTSTDVRQIRQNSTDQRHKIMAAITLIEFHGHTFT